MRKDVKLGLLLSSVVVVIAGWYYVRNDKVEEPLTLEDSTAAVKSQTARITPKKPTVLADARKPDPAGTGNRPSTTHRSTTKSPTRDRPAAHRPRTTQTHSTADSPRRRGSETRPSTKPKSKSQNKNETTTKPEPADKAEPVTKEKSARTKTGGDQPAKDAFEELFEFDKAASASPKPLPSPPGADVKSDRTPDQQPGVTARTDTGKKPKLTGPGPAKTRPQKDRPSAATGKTKSGKGYRTHTVRRGDSYALLAEMYYNSQRYARLLMDANPEHSDPRRLREGVVLRIPPLAPAPGPPHEVKASERGSAIPGQRTYVVREGDSFYRIAVRELGSGSRWPEIFELNKDAVGGKPECLRLGQVLVLPSDKPATTKSKRT